MTGVNFKKRAFSLIELSIVILIISILAAGAISVSGTFLISSKNQLTEKRMESIYNALGVFVAKNHRLPCPAPINKSKTDSNYGKESGSSPVVSTARDCDGSGVYSSNLESNLVYGMVPVNSLGLSDDVGEDGFGSKFSYIVHEGLTVPNYDDVGGAGNDGFSYYSEADSEMIQIYQLPSENTIRKVAFAIISHGQNKLGAFNANSTVQNSTSSIETQEGYNALSNISGTAADFGLDSAITPSRVTFTSLNSASDDFDDKVFYKNRDEIISDFDLEYLYFCDSSDTGYESGYQNAYNGQTVFRSTPCSSDPSIYPSKQCGAMGTVWINKITCP